MDETTARRPDHQRRLKAAEIALGLVGEADCASLLREDPALRDEVETWRRQLAWLADELTPIAPSAATWTALSARIDAEAGGPEPAATLPARFAGLMNSLVWWRSWAGAGFAASAALALVLLLRAPAVVVPPPEPAARPQVMLISSLLPKDGPPLFIASFNVATATIIVAPAAADARPAGIPHLWLAPTGDRDPVPLGRLASLQPSKFVLAADVASLADRAASLVVTLEPELVADGGAPRGPVIAHGVFVEP